jgi:hypothetical protein
MFERGNWLLHLRAPSSRSVLQCANSATARGRAAQAARARLCGVERPLAGVIAAGNRDGVYHGLSRDKRRAVVLFREARMHCHGTLSHRHENWAPSLVGFENELVLDNVVKLAPRLSPANWPAARANLSCSHFVRRKTAETTANSNIARSDRCACVPGRCVMQYCGSAEPSESSQDWGYGTERRDIGRSFGVHLVCLVKPEPQPPQQELLRCRRSRS